MAKTIKIVSRNKVRWTMLGILLIALLCGFIAYPTLPSSFPGSSFFNKFTPHLGLDLQGGTHLVYQADMSKISLSDQTSALEGVRDVIERRVNAFGVSEPLVQTQSGNRLIVDLAGVMNVNDAIKQIGETPILEFKESNNTPATLTAEQQKQQDDFNKAAYQKALEVNQKALAGQDFAALAKQYSDDETNKEQGGDLGFAKKGVYVPEFEKAIFNDLKVGQISAAQVKTVFGYHIIKKTGEQGSGDNLEVKASHILIKTEDLSKSQQATWSNTQLSGKNLTKAVVEFDPNTGMPTVGIEFDNAGKDLFSQITQRNVGKQVAIFLDGQIISAPTVQEAITQGKAVISGKFNLEQAKLLAQRLNAGALPVPISLVSQQTIGPSLGQISLQRSLMAGLIGILAVAIFMIVFYRLMGLFAVIALLIYTAINLAIYQMWPITLSLSGIAGFILSIGMAVDANVLIFERTKEELRNSKPLGTAIEEGFARAWLSIRDSNSSSIITSLILLWFGSSIIKGFAVTLLIGIITSLFSAITVTRTFLRFTTGKFFVKHQGWFCVTKKEDNKQ